MVNTTGGIENGLNSMFTNVIGTNNEFFLAVLFIGAFGIIVLLQNTRIDGKIVIFIPILMLAGAITGWTILLAILLAVLLGYLALRKIQQR